MSFSLESKDLLRLALIVLGVLLVAGIYFYEKWRRRAADSLENPYPGEFPEAGTEPESLPPQKGDSGAISPARDERDGDRIAVGDLSTIIPDPEERPGPRRGRKSDERAAGKKTRAVTAGGASGEEMIVALTVMARKGRDFSGDEVRSALEAAGLRRGEMDIFHYPESTAANAAGPLFSAANVVEPGTLRPEDLKDLSTPGLLLFARIPGPAGAQGFEEMLAVCRRLADMLDGELRDESRSSLTTQSIAHIRERIREFQRRQLLSER